MSGVDIVTDVLPLVWDRLSGLDPEPVGPAADRRGAAALREAGRQVVFGVLAAHAEARGLVPPEAWWTGATPAERRRWGGVATRHTALSVGLVWEHLLGAVPRRGPDGWRLARHRERREAGAYFTPPGLARRLTEASLAPWMEAGAGARPTLPRLVDPACGGGVFLVAALARLIGAAEAAGTPRAVAVRRAADAVHGLDVDPVAVAITRALLWIEAAAPDLPADCWDDRVRVGDALEGPAPGHADFLGRCHFPTVFAPDGGGGFDLVLGNPPWGKIKGDIKEFVTLLDVRGRDLQGEALRALTGGDVALEAAWRAFREERAGYARRLRRGGGFPAVGARIPGVGVSGDVDLHRYFVERAHQLVHAEGRLGLLLPAALHQTEGAAGLRALLLDTGTIELLLTFENRDRVFPIHGMFPYAALVWQGGAPGGVGRARFRLPRHDLGWTPGPGDVSLDRAWLTAVSGARRVIPELRGPEDAAIYAGLCASHPPLEASHSAWNMGFVRELDMTEDRRHFREHAEVQAGPEGTWEAGGVPVVPVYEGRMVHQFDPMAKAYRGGSGRRARWEVLPLGEKGIRPHHFVLAGAVRAQGVDRWRAGFCDITGCSNERTALAALLPPGLPAGNKVPTLRFDREDPRLPLLWIALANSFVVDWHLRRRVSTTLNYFHWRMTPFPRLPVDDPTAERLWRAAAGLSGIDTPTYVSIQAALAPADRSAGGPPGARARARLRAEIDVLVAGLFGLGPAALARILDDFPLLDRHQPAIPGEARSTVTRDLVFATLHAARGDTSETAHFSARVEAAEAAGAVAYVPGEHARGSAGTAG